jgi:hypothetical protein
LKENQKRKSEVYEKCIALHEEFLAFLEQSLNIIEREKLNLGRENLEVKLKITQAIGL